MTNDPIHIEKYRTEKEIEPIIGQMDGPDLAGILALALQCWIEDVEELRALPDKSGNPSCVRRGQAFFSESKDDVLG